VTDQSTPTIHASAVLAGARAVLIRGSAGAGKSRLAYALCQAGKTGALPFSRLIGDDRVHVQAANGRLLVHPAPALAGLIEVRSIGVLRLPFEPAGVVGLVVDLGDADTERLPPELAETAIIEGIRLPRLAVAPGNDPLPLVLTRLLNLAQPGSQIPEFPAAPALVGKK
jgi:serine kinase of HPr protein (carbohydrate metabolism regulator)